MFNPNYVYIEREALEYEKGRKIKRYFTEKKVPITLLNSNRMTGLPTTNAQERYQHGKKSLVVSVRRSMKFQTCKPSAHYQLPLVTGCMGGCEYCYLQTRFSKQPYTRLYVNVDDILNQASKYIEERSDTTIFEGAAVSDPIPVEHLTGALADTISFFAKNQKARFTFVTKYTDIDSLLNIEHKKHTTIRFSLNLPHIIKKFEHRTPNLEARIKAAKAVQDSEYPLGFIIAPVLLEDNWQENYNELIDHLYSTFKNTKDLIVLEVISHRFTAKAKETILELYPDSELPLDEEDRKFKFGQFGYGKYLYPKEMLNEMKEYFTSKVESMGDMWSIKYII